MATRDDKLTRLRSALRAEQPREWWWWDIDAFRAGHRAMGFDLPWPYLRPTGLIPGPWWTRELNMRRLNGFIEGAIDQQLREIRQSHRGMIAYQRPTVELLDASLGAMTVIAIEWWLRGQRRIYMSPPVYKFCDLDKAFPDAPDILKPFDFWIQPEVFHQTGQILHGGIVASIRTREEDRAAMRHVPRPQLLLSVLNDSPEFKAELEHVHVALDAWLERFDRTGETSPDPRFTWTWAEERAMQAARIEDRFYLMSERHPDLSRGKYNTLTDAKRAAMELVRERGYPQVEVWHHWRGDDYLQGIASAEGWSDV